MVWVYDRAKSLLLAILMHFPIVVGVFVLVPQTMPAIAVVTFDLVFGCALWLVVAVVAHTNRGPPLVSNDESKGRMDRCPTAGDRPETP